MNKTQDNKKNSPTQKILWVGLVGLILAISLFLFIPTKQNNPSEQTKQTGQEINQPLEQTTLQSDKNETNTDSTDAQPKQGASMAEIQDIIEEQGRLSITGKPIDRAALKANKAKMMDELMIKKRTINASTMSPLMALEYEQFGRYLDRGQYDLADQLLTDMQESWPEYDYEDMIYRLALAETGTNQ